MRILLGDDAYVYLSIPLPVLPPPPPPPPPFYAHKIRHKHVISTGLSVGASLLGAVLFLGIFCIVSRAYRRRQGNQRRRAAGIVPANFGNQEDFSDENQGPELDHPIWHIRTVGLQQSVIDAIAVFEYKRGEGLVEGTDCSVCLNEFEDDEMLRLLPKCGHAFHLPCIDTWLRSHKNCPVCRAPVVSVDSDGRVDLLMPVSSGLSSREAQIGNSAAGGSGSVNDLEGQDGDLKDRIGDGNVSASEGGANSGTGSSKLTLHHSNLSDHVQVRSDLTELREDVKAAIQPMRRSVSLDSSSALAIYAAVSQVVHGKQPGNLDSTKQSKQSRAKHLDKRGTTGSLSFRKLMTSSSIRKSLQMGPISTKRSFSLRGKSSSSSSSLGGSGRRDSILPLQG